MNFSEDRVVDEFLVMRCQAGDRDALSALVIKWQPPFLRYAAVMTRDNELAADVLQEAWIKIIRSLPKLKEPLKFPAWAYRIINNQCLDMLRKQQRGVTPESREPATPIADLEEREQVLWVLDQLTPDHRSVLALHYLQGFDVAQIASIVGKPRGTVKSRLFNARERFREIFTEQESLSAEQPPAEKGANHERSGHTHTESVAGSLGIP